MLSLPPNLIDKPNSRFMTNIRFEKKPFSEALKTASMCAGVNTTMPILDNVRVFSHEYGGVSLMSSSLDMTVEKHIMPYEPYDGEFDFCVPAKDLNSAVSRLSDYVFGMNIDTENNRLEIVYGSGRITLPILPSDEFPFTGVDGSTERQGAFNIKTSMLSYIIDTCKDFVGNDELRPNMMGIFIGVDGNGNVEYCATDAHRLVCEKMPLETTVYGEVSLILPKRTNAALKSVCSDGDIADVGVYDNKFTVTTDSCTLTATKSEGKYPNYRALVQQAEANDKKFRINKANLEGAVSRMMSAASASTQMVRVEVFGNTLTLASEDADLGKTARESIDLSTKEGDDITFGLNGVFFKDCISIVSDNYIAITASSPNRAVIIVDDNRPTKTILLMPVMLNV